MRNNSLNIQQTFCVETGESHTQTDPPFGYKKVSISNFKSRIGRILIEDEGSVNIIVNIVGIAGGEVNKNSMAFAFVLRFV
jgi:hypothetical protein